MDIEEEDTDFYDVHEPDSRADADWVQNMEEVMQIKNAAKVNKPLDSMFCLIANFTAPLLGGFAAWQEDDRETHPGEATTKNGSWQNAGNRRRLFRAFAQCRLSCVQAFARKVEVVLVKKGTL